MQGPVSLTIPDKQGKVRDDNPLPVKLIDAGGDELVINGDGSINVPDYHLQIARGDVSGVTYVHKFGATPDFDTDDGSVDVWDGANDAVSDLMTYTYSSTADIDRISSSDNGDTQDIEIQGLDASYDLTVQTVTLTGQTAATLTTPLIRVFRLKNVGSTNNAGRIYCFKAVATSSGVPNTLSNIRAEMAPGNNQSLMALYTIPNGKTGYMDSFYSSTAGASRTADYIIDLFARPQGQVFQLKHRNAIQDGANSSIFKDYRVPERFAAKTDIVIRASTPTNSITGATIAAGFDLVLVDD